MPLGIYQKFMEFRQPETYKLSPPLYPFLSLFASHLPLKRQLHICESAVVSEVREW